MAILGMFETTTTGRSPARSLFDAHHIRAGTRSALQPEVRDAAPEDDTTDRADVVDIPYRSLSGKVGLGYVTGGFSGVSDRLPILMHPSDVARQLGMPEPVTLADTLDVFAMLG